MSTTRIALGCVLAALTLGAAAPALAAPAKDFDYFTATEKTKGRAHVYGSIDFERRTQAYIQGHLNDLCPGDSRGAYVLFYGQFARTDGSYHSLGERKDTRTCKAKAPIDFGFWTPKFKNKRLIRVIAMLRECDGDYCDGDFTTFDRVP